MLRFSARAYQYTLITTICFSLLVLYGLPVLARSFNPMLPQIYSSQNDVSGWLMSEKLDGIRAYWDGRQLFSKNGNLFHPPAEFLRNLPDFALEGELWGGRGTFPQTASTVKTQHQHPGWNKLKFAIFDAPTVPGGFTQRMAQVKRWFIAHPSTNAYIIKQTRVDNAQHLQQQLAAIELAGGEGLIVRQPHAPYVAGRNSAILKVKSYQDKEATVIAHLPGHGRNSGRMGALLVQLEDGIRFRIGSGFSDKQRERPPAIGATISFKHYGSYPSGIPKFPSFIRVRKDVGL